MNTEIYFNGQQAYFDKEEIITGTYALNKVGDLKSRQGINTNTYSLPFIKQNKAIFKDCELISNEGDGPYVAYEHEVIIEGISVFKGTAFVTEAWGTYKVQAVAGNSDFYLLLNNKALKDLDYSDLNHTRDDATIIASWENTEGYIYPFIDYGKYQTVDNNSDGNTICPIDLYPAIFNKTIIQKIADYTGYIFRGDVFQNQRFLDEFIPFTKFPFTPDINNPVDNSYKLEANSSLINIGSKSTIIPLLTVLSGVGYDAYGFYTNPFPRYVTINLQYLADIVDPSKRMDISIIKRPASIAGHGGYDPSTDQRLIYISKYTSDTSTQTVEKKIFLNTNDRIFIVLYNDSGPTLAFPAFITISSFSITNASAENGYNQYWNFANNVPDIKLNKFILDFMNRYGLSIKTDNELRVIEFISDDDLLLKNPVDWTGKIDYSNKSETDSPDVSFRFDKYTQNNLLSYKTESWLPDGFDYTFTIADERLSTEVYEDFISEFSLAPIGAAFSGAVQTINVNMFSEKENLNFQGLFIFGNDYFINDVVFSFNAFYKSLVDNPTDLPTDADTTQWEIITESDAWDIQSGIPLISRIKRDYSGPTVDFQIETPQQIKVFAINTDMDWPTIWENHYQLLKRILDKTKAPQLPLLLTYADISNLDLTRPVWLREYGLNFKVDEVLQFKFNQVDSTLVRLIRI